MKVLGIVNPPLSPVVGLVGKGTLDVVEGVVKNLVVVRPSMSAVNRRG